MVLGRARFTFLSSSSFLLPKVAREQRQMFLNHGWDLHLFSCLPQNLSPVNTLLSQLLAQKKEQWSDLALPCVNQWSRGHLDRACSGPQGLGIQTQLFPVLTSGILWRLRVFSAPEQNQYLSGLEVWQPKQAQHKDWPFVIKAAFREHCWPCTLHLFSTIRPIIPISKAQLSI